MPAVLYPSKVVLDSYLRSLRNEIGLSFKSKGYVAPTVYLRQGKVLTTTGWAYYTSILDAYDKLKYIFHAGGRDVKPAGYVVLKKDGTPQTIGMNCDFYFAVNSSQVVNLGYKALKFSIENNTGIVTVFRFFKPDSTGPYFAIFDPAYLGAAATVVSAYGEDKIDALDRFHREVALLKVKHNTLAVYLNQLAARQLNPVEQQVFNQGVLHLQTLRSEIDKLRPGVEIYLSKDGTIGFIAIPLIAWLIVGAIAAGWTVSKIVEQVQKTARLNASYDVQKWVADQKLKIAQELQRGTISPGSASALNSQLTQVSQQAGENAATASAPGKSLFGDIADIVKWAAIGLGVYAIANAAGNSGNKKSK